MKPSDRAQFIHEKYVLLSFMSKEERDAEMEKSGLSMCMSILRRMIGRVLIRKCRRRAKKAAEKC